MTDFAKRLDQIVGGLAVVFYDQEAHMGIGCGQVGQPSVTMARAASSCKATRASNLLFEHDPEDRCRPVRTMFKVKKRAVKLGGTSPPFLPSDGGGRIPPEGTIGSGLLTRSPERAVGGGD